MVNTVVAANDRMPGDALILFGITGDLGNSKIIPALGDLERAGELDGVAVVGVGRSQRSDDDIRSMMRAGLSTDDGSSPGDSGETDDVVERIGLRYVSGDATDTSTFDELADLLGEASAPVVYAAVPPAAFGDLAQAIHASEMPGDTRLVVEKPFGTNESSALDLHREMTRSIGEANLFIVDHFLAKAAVENLFTVRTMNAIFDQLLHRRAVGSITVEMLERDDVAGRGSFYDDVGVVDDVVQNHVLQMAALALMECPEHDTAEAYHEARAATIDAMTIRADSIVFGQYEGYGTHDDVADDSRTATYVAFTIDLDSERWRDVPIRVVTGKSLDRESTAVRFELDGPGENEIVLSVKPDPTISIGVTVLDADAPHAEPTDTPIRRQEAVLCGPSAHAELGDYATLLADALGGVGQHFARIGDVVAAWRLVAPLESGDVRPQRYPRGSSGPT